jgi:hypothetical protein
VRRRQKSGITERDLSHFRYLSVLAVRLNKQNKEKPATIKFTRRWAKKKKKKKKLLLDRQSLHCVGLLDGLDVKPLQLHNRLHMSLECVKLPQPVT